VDDATTAAGDHDARGRDRKGHFVFYTLIFAGLAILLVVAWLLQRRRSGH
jgi:hypothetical protein